MPTSVFELNDVGVSVTLGDETLVESPGYAVVDKGTLEIGEPAYHAARLNPRHTHTRFWERLSLDALPGGTAAARSYADLAFAHLESLWTPLRERSDAVLFAVPGCFTREQLGLLLGIAHECGIPMVGLVDAAVAATPRAAPGRRLMHLDVLLHRIVLTPLAQGAMLSRGPVEEIRKFGLVALKQAWAEAIADAFVRTTRFDPMHHARSEQTLYDRLPQWLSQLEDTPTLQLELEAGRIRHTVTIKRVRLIEAAEEVYAAIERRIAACTRPGEPITLQLSHRVAKLPGLAQRLGRLPDCEIVRLPAAAAARGALRQETHIRAPGERVSFVTSLPLEEAAAVPGATADEGTDRGGRLPTHVLYGARAYPLGQQPLVVGAAIAPEERGFNLVGALAGVSRRHCSFARADGRAQLTDLSRFGTFLNDRKVEGSASLRAGDRVRVGAPGQELLLIELADSDGA